MNTSKWAGASVINTVGIHCSMKVTFRNFEFSCNTYILNYLCYIWSLGQHLVDSCIALFLKSLTLLDVYGFIFATLLIVLMGFPRRTGACYSESAHKCSWSKLYDVHHEWKLPSWCRPLDSGGFNGCLSFPTNSMVGGSILIENSM